MLDTDHGLENQLQATVYTVAVLTCHCTNAFAAIVTLADPTSGTTPAGKGLMAALGCWALYRLATRSLRNVFIAIDYAFVLAICAASPRLITGSELVQQWGTQQAVAASAIVTLAVVLPVRISLPMTALILATYDWASASVFGWESVAAMASLRYFAIAVAMSVLIRVALLRVAAATKRAHETYWRAGGIRKRVAAAARRYEREQFALLHDTAASTLLLVGNGTPVPQEKLVAQARSALAVLNGQPSTHPLQRIELVAALRELADGTCTPARFRGSPQLWLDGELGMAVVAAVREAINNVDRHASATEISVDISNDRVTVADNGSGFRVTPLTTGHGIAESIVGRMKRVGASANIHSAAGRGTNVELCWADRRRRGHSPGSDTELDRLLEVISSRYRYALLVPALLALILTVPYSIDHNANPPAQMGLAALAALSSLVALPTLKDRHRTFRSLAVTALLIVTVVQPRFLPLTLLCQTAQWSPWVTGWCLSPLVLVLPLRIAIAILAANWVGACAVTLARDPPARALAGLLLLGGHFLVVQVFAQIAHSVTVDAAAATHAKRQAHFDRLTREQVAAALDAGFQRRYAAVRRSVVPLLTKLSRGEPIDSTLRQRARAEYQRIRTLLDEPCAVDHPLLRALRPAVNAAAKRNVDVDVHVQSEPPELPEADVEQLTEVISHMLDRCTTSVRLVLTTMGNEFVVSVVCRGRTYVGESGGTNLITANGELEIVTREDTTWLTISHQILAAPSDDILDYDGHVF